MMDILNLKTSELEIFELDIKKKLVQISKGEIDCLTKYFHVPFLRNHTIRIHSQMNFMRSSPSCTTDDRLAHHLSFFGDEFPENFFRAVDHIVIIPEFIYSSSFFLTHLYIPCERILSFYMYPQRLNLNLETFQENRMTGRKIVRTGLLHNTAVSVSRIFNSPSTRGCSDLHKFVHPMSELSRNEILEMKDFAESREFANPPGEMIHES